MTAWSITGTYVPAEKNVMTYISLKDTTVLLQMREHEKYNESLYTEIHSLQEAMIAELAWEYDPERWISHHIYITWS